MSEIVAEYILSMLEESDGNAEIQRNELALTLGCVPSQINYVITSRFTPEQGFIVESRRGGGGYIRISRKSDNINASLMHIINSVGLSLDSVTAEIMLENMLRGGIISPQASKIIRAGTSDRVLYGVPQQHRDNARASLMKNMLLTQI